MKKFLFEGYDVYIIAPSHELAVLTIWREVRGIYTWGENVKEVDSIPLGALTLRYQPLNVSNQIQ